MKGIRQFLKHKPSLFFLNSLENISNKKVKQKQRRKFPTKIFSTKKISSELTYNRIKVSLAEKIFDKFGQK